jgi:hypothetical protein
MISDQPITPIVKNVGLLPILKEGPMSVGIRFDAPLTFKDQLALQSQVFAFAEEDGERYLFRLEGEKDNIVELRPDKGQVIEYADYEDLIDYLGIKISGPLPILDRSFLEEESDQVIRMVHRTPSFVH